MTPVITKVPPTVASDTTKRSELLPNVPGPASNTAQTNFFGSAFPLTFDLLTNQTALTPAGEYWSMSTDGRNLHAIQVTGNGAAFTGTVLVEGTIDDQNWAQITTITTESIYQFTGLYTRVRVSISAYTSGDISVIGKTMRG